MERNWRWAGVAGVVGLGASWASATEQALVDLSITGAPMTYRASGFLHSIDPSSPADALVAPLKPQMLRMRPAASAAMDARASQLGVQHMQIIISDGFGNDYTAPFPGDGGDWTSWDTYVTNLATSVASNAVPVQFDVWNEPDISAFWPRSPSQFFEAWRRAVVDIRAVNPAAQIVGPSFSSFSNTAIGMDNFLLYARDNNVLPDVLSWHAFTAGFVSQVADVRSFMSANGINVSRISLNEIVGQTNYAGGKLWASAGPLAKYFSNVERANVESVAHACWDEPNAPGVNNGENDSLDGLLTPDTKQPRSTWWMYERYAEMEGTVSGFQAGVVTNSGGVATFDGLSTKEDGKVQVLFGRFSEDSAPVELKLTHLDQVPDLVVNGSVLVTGELIANSGLNASSGPTVAFSQVMTVTGGQLVVPISLFGPADGYFLTITPSGPTGPTDPTEPADPAEPVTKWVKDTGGAWSDEFAWDNVPPNGAGVAARLAAGSIGVRTIYVDTAWTLGTLIMDDPAGFTITGSSILTIDNGSARGMIKANAGVNELDVKVQLGIEGTPPDISVADGATLKLGRGNRLKVATIFLHSSGTLDLGGNDMVVEDDQLSAVATEDRLRKMLLAGYHGGAWDGAGLRSGAVTAGSGTALGYAVASQIGVTDFDGQPLRAMAVIIVQTVVGDANLDGVLTADDYALIDRAFAMHLLDAHWVDGDFNYDGVVDAADYLLIDTAWAKQAGLLSPSLLTEREAQFGLAYVAQLESAVPEPGAALSTTAAVVTTLAAGRTRVARSDARERRAVKQGRRGTA